MLAARRMSSRSTLQWACIQTERRVVADRADVAEVICKPLKFGQQHPQPDRAIWHLQLQGGLGGFRKRIGIGDGAIARYTSGELRGALDAGTSHQPFDTLVGVSQPLFQPDHGFAAGGEPEMSGSIMPACTGPTAIWCRPSPSAGRKR